MYPRKIMKLGSFVSLFYTNHLYRLKEIKKIMQNNWNSRLNLGARKNKQTRKAEKYLLD